MVAGWEGKAFSWKAFRRQVRGRWPRRRQHGNVQGIKVSEHRQRRLRTGPPTTASASQRCVLLSCASCVCFTKILRVAESDRLIA